MCTDESRSALQKKFRAKDLSVRSVLRTSDGMLVAVIFAFNFHLMADFVSISISTPNWAANSFRTLYSKSNCRNAFDLFRLFAQRLLIMSIRCQSYHPHQMNVNCSPSLRQWCDFDLATASTYLSNQNSIAANRLLQMPCTQEKLSCSQKTETVIFQKIFDKFLDRNCSYLCPVSIEKSQLPNNLNV